jgi:hypothetical protein
MREISNASDPDETPTAYRAWQYGAMDASRDLTFSQRIKC